VMLTGMRARMAMMRMRMQIRRKNHDTPMMDQHRVWSTESIVGDVDGYDCDDVDADQEE
jgi:hypothetical protein